MLSIPELPDSETPSPPLGWGHRPLPVSSWTRLLAGPAMLKAHQMVLQLVHKPKFSLLRPWERKKPAQLSRGAPGSSWRAPACCLSSQMPADASPRPGSQLPAAGPRGLWDRTPQSRTCQARRWQPCATLSSLTVQRIRGVVNESANPVISIIKILYIPSIASPTVLSLGCREN